MKFDKEHNIENIIYNRIVLNAEVTKNYDFLTIQNEFLNYMMNKTTKEIEQYLCILPTGSIIFHGATAKTWNNSSNQKKWVPPIYPTINTTNNYTGIKKLLNEEAKPKTIGTIVSDDNLTDIEKQEKINLF